MLETNYKNFINSIRLAIGERCELSPTIDAEHLLRISSMHDLTHLVHYGFVRARMVECLKDKTKDFESAHAIAVFRYLKIARELNDMANALERAEIDFMFLKGSQLRFYYPEPWMRTSSDIDVLIKEDSEKQAHKVLEKLNYKYIGKHQRAVRNFKTPSGVHIELHTQIRDNGDIADEYLKSVWDTAIRENGYGHKYKMDDCTFLFHHVAHMAKHFCNGGCGVRSFLDLCILNGRGESIKFFEMLDVAGLREFYNSAKSLGEFWFKEGPQAYPSGMDTYVFRGGLFGTFENTVDANAKNGKMRYLMGKTFPSCAEMKEMHPVLKKLKLLLPFYYVARFFKIMFKAVIGKGRDELKAVRNLNKNRAENTQKLFKKLGLRQQ